MANLTIESIPSALPGWFDPSAPSFKPPKDWKGARVRITIPITVDPVKELEEARQRLSKKYVGAELHLIPDFQKQSAPSSINVKGSDEDLLRDYFCKLALPEHITVDQLVVYLKRHITAISVFGVQGLEFQSVKSTNVLCFETCDWNLTQTGLTLVTGKNEDWDSKSNGAGKSSFCGLPFVGLFGRTFKGQTHDEWANQSNDKSAKLVESLKLHDGRILEVHRQRRPSLLRAFLDGQEVSMGTPAATQAMIEKLTNLTWEILTNALYIGQNEIGSVFGTEKERKELFSRLLGLERFLDVQKVLNKIALRVNRAAEAIDNDISAVTSAIEEAQINLKSNIAELKQTPQISSSAISTLETTIKNLNHKIQDTTTKLNGVRQTREAVYSNLLRKAERLVDQIEATITVLRKQLKDTEQARDRCHICGNKVDAKILEKYRAELNCQIADEQKKLKVLNVDVQKHRDTISAASKVETEIEEQRERLRKQERTASLELGELQSKKNAQQRLSSIANDQKTRILKLTHYLLIHTKAKEYTLLEKQFLDFCVGAVSRNGLPAYLCEVVAPQLNKTAAHYSEVFSEGEIGVQFVISGGDIDVRINNLHGGKNIKDQSAGEMRMAGIITAFTFRDVLVPLNLLICDEPSEGLDAANSLAFAKGLNQVIDRFQHIVVISHNSSLLGALEPDRHIEIVKKNGISSVHTV